MSFTDKPYLLVDTYHQEVVRTFATQDKAMSCLLSFLNTEPDSVLRDLNLIYVNEDESESLLCYATQSIVKQWKASLDRLSFDLRMIGPDLGSVEEYVEMRGISVEWYESDTPLNELDLRRYNAHIGGYEMMYPGGATRLEALAHAFVGYKHTEKRMRTIDGPFK